MTTEEPADEDFVHCYECGAEIRRSVDICNECGVRQKPAPQSQSVSGGGPNPAQASGDERVPDSRSQQTTAESTDLLQEYSIGQWLAAIGVGFITFPLGLVVPVYLYYKAQNGTGSEQSGLESWTAILFGIVGILAVEVGGRTAAKVLWGICILLVVLGVFVVVGA